MKKFILFAACAMFAASGINAQFLLSPNGLGPIEIGTDFRELPTQVADLYDGFKLVVLSGSEDGVGVNLAFKKGEKAVAFAALEMNDDQIEALYGMDMAGKTYSALGTNELVKWLIKNNVNKIGRLEVTSEANDSVEVGNKTYSVSDPFAKFVSNPKAYATASLAEGVMADCTIGNLVLIAYGCLTEKAENQVVDMLMNQGYVSVTLDAEMINPDTKASRILYEK